MVLVQPLHRLGGPHHIIVVNISTVHVSKRGRPDLIIKNKRPLGGPHQGQRKYFLSASSFWVRVNCIRTSNSYSQNGLHLGSVPTLLRYHLY